MAARVGSGNELPFFLVGIVSFGAVSSKLYARFSLKGSQFDTLSTLMVYGPSMKCASDKLSQ